jgi:hypothetical protein
MSYFNVYIKVFDRVLKIHLNKRSSPVKRITVILRCRDQKEFVARVFGAAAANRDFFA